MRHARRYRVEPAWCAKSFDIPFYRDFINKTYAEISYAFTTGEPKKKPV
jgi:hypothetical protein